MKNTFYFIAIILLLTACVDPVQEQLDVKKQELASLGMKMEQITKKVYAVIDQKADAETFVLRLELAGVSKNSKDYKNAVADVQRFAAMHDSLNNEADKIAIEVDKIGAQIDSLLLIER